MNRNTVTCGLGQEQVFKVQPLPGNATRLELLNIDIDTFVTLLSTVAFLLPLVYSLYSASVLRGGCYYSLLCMCPVAETVE